MQNNIILLLGSMFCVLGLFLAIIYIIARRHTDLPIKFIGSFFILALCFFAKNAWTYGAGIFIIATLVTELEFLEKLAAIFWGRKEYFDYLMRKASKEEIKEKIEEEYLKSQPSAYEKKDMEKIKKDKINYINESLRFELEVLDAITIKEKGGFLPKHHLKKDVSVKAADNKAIFDAIADYDKYYFIIEVRNSTNLNLLSRAARELHVNSYVFERYLYDTKRRGEVRLLLICPATVAVDGIDGIPLLQYDKIQKKFLNGDKTFRRLTETQNDTDIFKE